MKKRSFLCFLLVFALLFTATVPVCAAGAATCSDDGSAAPVFSLRTLFRSIADWLRSLWKQFRTHWEVKKEGVHNTMRQNVIHMLRSVTDTIGDSFIITTEDGKVIVIDGGHRTETDYFLEYLKAVTGKRKPHIDAWFLSHAHEDHCEVFLEIVENRKNVLTFDKVYANFPDASFYDGIDEWAVTILRDYDRLKPAFADKAESLHEGDVFSVGAAQFAVFYTFNPAWKSCNDASTIMRMDLGGSRVMFNGDAGIKPGNYVVEKYADTGMLRCDMCKMAHHGQDGVGQNFYEAVAPDVCLWPTPTWVYENTNGNLQTFETRSWVKALGVRKEYKSFEGSAAIRTKPRIVTTTDVFEDGYPMEQAAERLAAIGYEGIDAGFDYWTFDGSPFLGDDYLRWAQDVKAHADAAGIVCSHAHAPGEADDDMWLERSIEAASVLGARYLVVHPIWKDADGKTIHSKQRFLQINAEAIRKWLPKAEECGVVLLSENLLWDASADPRVIAQLVKTVDSPWFGWCFDVGHAYCSAYAPDVLRQCCVVPLSLHIQDNDGAGDGHLIPGDGTIDWDAFVRVLLEIGYTGDCVLEAHHQSLEAPDAERDAILTRLLNTARELREKMRYS